MRICALNGGKPKNFPATASFLDYPVMADENGGFCMEYAFPSEQEYFIRIYAAQDTCRRERLLQLAVYCVDGDLVGKYPFAGDLHMHTTCSDGNQCPEVVCANYRKHGYDFTVISDHERY